MVKQLLSSDSITVGTLYESVTGLFGFTDTVLSLGDEKI
jgi:hypothetical protein